MGKIFKALEKAEKKEIAKQGKYSVVNAKGADSPATDKLNNRKPVALSNTQSVPDTDPVSKVIQATSPGRVKTVERTKMKQEISHPPSSTDKQTVAHTDPLTSDKSEGEELPGERAPYLDKKASSLPKPVPESHQLKEEESNAVNLEVISAQPDETVQQEIAPINQPPTKGDAVIERDIREDRERERVNVRYSKTKVQFNDPERLKNNRVLSIFDDVDTANQFKILRTQVLRKLKNIGGNCILVTSANPYEGKTFTSINLGLSIAKEFDRTVLIIDADIRRPTKHHTDFSTEFFSLKVEKGLSDYLTGDADIEDILINPGIDKITLIPGGVPVENSPELLNSPRMERMMAEIKSRYPSDRLVIVDGPALLHFPDAMILYRYVDGVLPVVESERTSAEDLKKVMKQLKDVNLLGVVLNKNKG